MMVRSILALGLLAATAGAARAATLVTPAIPVPDNGRAVCTLLNPTSRNVPLLRWEIVYDDGRVLETFPGSTLRAGFALELGETPAGAGVGGGLWYCRAEVAGSGKQLRLSLCTLGSSGTCSAVAVAP